MPFSTEYYPTVEQIQERVNEHPETTEAINAWVALMEDSTVPQAKIHQALIDRLDAIRHRERDRPVDIDDGSDDFDVHEMGGVGA